MADTFFPPGQLAEQLTPPFGPGATMQFPAGPTSPFTPPAQFAPGATMQFPSGPVSPYTPPASFAPGATMQFPSGPGMRFPAGPTSPFPNPGQRLAGATQAPITGLLGRPQTPAAQARAARTPVRGLIGGPPGGRAGTAAAAGERPGLGTRLFRGLAGRSPLGKFGIGAAGLGIPLAGSLASQGIQAAVPGEFGRDLGNVAEFAGLGAGAGLLLGGGIGAGIGGLAGGAFGALSFIPGIEDVPVLGGILGGKPKGDLKKEIRTEFSSTLRSLGAPPEFISRMTKQLDIAYQVRGAFKDKGLTNDELRVVSTEVLNAAIEQFGIEQQQQGQLQQQQQQLGGNFDRALAEIAAVQAWMAPLIQQQLGRSQFYADQYAQMGRAAAAHLEDPALASAGAAMATQWSADQAQANAIISQQLAHQPDAWRAALEQQFNEQQLALQAQALQIQQAQFAQEQGQLGLPGLAPGLYPTG